MNVNSAFTWAGIIGGALVLLWLTCRLALGLYDLVQFQNRALAVVTWYEQIVVPQMQRQQAMAEAKAKPTPAAEPPASK